MVYVLTTKLFSSKVDNTGEHAAAHTAGRATFQEKKAVFNNLEVILERIACCIVSFMYGAEWGQWAGSNLDEAIQKTMVQYPGGLHELIAVAVFESLMDTIYRLPTKALLGHAFNTAGKVMYARGFVNMGHQSLPKASQAMRTLGILMILAPSIVFTLGFELTGPFGGSWTASWQRNFGEVVDIEELCAFLRELDRLYRDIW